MRIFGPLVCATTSPVTATLASFSASVTRSGPSTTSTADSDTASPGAPTSFSTSITSPSATLYCLPPVLTIAYIGRGLLSCCGRMDRGGRHPSGATHDNRAHEECTEGQAYVIERGRPKSGSLAELGQRADRRRDLPGDRGEVVERAYPQ